MAKNDFDDLDSLLDSVEDDIVKESEKMIKDIINYGNKVIKEKIYGAYSPVIYDRIWQLYEALQYKIIHRKSEIVIYIYLTDKIHDYNPTWKGRQYSLSEIIDDYFKQDHVYTNGFYREGVDVMGEVQNFAFGEALNTFYNELRKKFNIE